MASTTQSNLTLKSRNHSKPGIFDKEACDICRQQKANCDGGQPCSRSLSCGGHYNYDNRPRDKLQGGLQEPRGIENQPGAALEVSAALSQKPNQPCLDYSVQFDTVHGGIDSRNILLPSDALIIEQNLSGEEKRLMMLHQILPTTPVDTKFNQSITSPFEPIESVHDQASVAYQAPSWSGIQPYDPMARRCSTTLFDIPVSPRDMTYYNDTISSSSTPRSNSMDGNPITGNVNALHGNLCSTQSTIEFGPVDWWTSDNLQPTTPYFPLDSGMDSAFWDYSNAPVLIQPSLPVVYSLPSATQSPISMNSSYGFTPPTSGETTGRHSFASSEVMDGREVDEERAPPQKKRKSNNDVAEKFPQAPGKPVLQRRHSTIPATQPPALGRERHRRASARNWQKQKQQSADLESAKDTAEARNRELHQEHSKILNQVMNLKNALMDHAECNHPAINGWLRCQAANYVLTKGGSVDMGWKREVESGAGLHVLEGNGETPHEENPHNLGKSDFLWGSSISSYLIVSPFDHLNSTLDGPVSGDPEFDLQRSLILVN
ncbi:uncharacterized protein BDZ83DRAFT_656831 [Colletotrichum acutatum]|uniref:Zn(2)-C6 fungal-type domain-containing protein n=1 Tax=Glomerella acutata TaxID=27357 RepID=A0AAD8XCT3_GLOAC|nr:uncharacterized protein BDZ83DRAFT_656831 [Colletotrichum acutatum]KAK1711542.1 hypothetical protein BDZ83DRAFT_656831 [Colletotrichum acutatum]